MTPDNGNFQELTERRREEGIEANTNRIRAILLGSGVDLPESFQSNPIYATESTIGDTEGKELPIIIIKAKGDENNSLTLGPEGDDSDKYPDTVKLIKAEAYNSLIEVCAESVALTTETNLRNAI